jgi:hypothetical protein
MIQSLQEIFSPHLQSLAGFQFTIRNPAFWILFFVLFLVMLKFWNPRKSLYFCLVIAGILLLTTHLEHIFREALLRNGEAYDPFFLRMVAVFFIAIVAVYFFLIKPEQ